MMAANESLELDSILYGLRRLLVESSQQKKVIASMHEVKVIDFEKLKNH